MQSEILTYLAIVAAPLIALGVFLATPWGLPLRAILSTRVGMRAFAAGFLAFAVSVAARRTFIAGRRAGATSYKRDVEAANAQSVIHHETIARDVAKTSDDALRDELKRWAPLILITVGLGLGGCATVATGGPGKGGAWCEIERPIRLSAERVDAMTIDELKAAVTHNRHGEAECGWTAGARS